MVMLPRFKGYTIDYRLQEFRKAEYPKRIEFIPFNSEKGRKLLEEYEKEVKADDHTITHTGS